MCVGVSCCGVYCAAQKRQRPQHGLPLRQGTNPKNIKKRNYYQKLPKERPGKTEGLKHDRKSDQQQDPTIRRFFCLFFCSWFWVVHCFLCFLTVPRVLESALAVGAGVGDGRRLCRRRCEDSAHRRTMMFVLCLYVQESARRCWCRAGPKRQAHTGSNGIV